MSNEIQLKKGRDTSYDKILASYLNPEKFTLTTKQQEIKERWLAAWGLLLKKHSPTKVAKKLREKYKHQNLSRAQAFRDVSNATKLFGNVLHADRVGRMAIHYELALNGYKKAMKASDFSAAKGFLSEMRETYPFEDNPLFNPEKLENVPVKLVVDKAVEIAIVDELKGGVLDFNNLEVEDVSHEDIADE